MARSVGMPLALLGCCQALGDDANSSAATGHKGCNMQMCGQRPKQGRLVRRELTSTWEVQVEGAKVARPAASVEEKCSHQQMFRRS
jgi:hypothetical protein